MLEANKSFIYLMLIYLTCLKGYKTQQSQFYSIHDVDDFLREYNREAAEMCNRVATTEWKYATNISDYNRRRMKEQQSIATKFECLSWKRAASFDLHRLVDTSTKRQLEKILRHGKCGLPDDKYLEITHLITVMKDAYNSARICPFRSDQHIFVPQYNNPHNDLNKNTHNAAPYNPTYTNYCDLRLDPELTKIMEVSRNEQELLYVWAAWREKTGPSIRNSFMRYIDLANQAARIHGFRDAGEQMRAVYDDTDFYFTVQDLWTQIQPLYKKLFTYVRKGLVRKYGNMVVRHDGPIPAHLLGNMWGQNWKNILDIIRPELPETPDVTGELVRQGYTPLKIFQTAEEFFTSMGLPPMSPEFWRNSMLSSNEMGYSHCSASAWDFCNNIDFRIKQCTQITIEDFINSHHEMTHILYYMQYSTQPFVYREGPNPAFHEAMAHTIGLSVGGPVHLQRLGLLTTPIPTTNGNSLINIEYLLELALDKLPFMAFSIALEKWRWFVFEKGPIGLNARWWDLRLRYQGLVPPTQRTREHFDAGAKYHVISDQDYIKYFVATVLQFQIFSELCQASGHVGPLHTCDIYRSREAGRLISELMQQGASMSSSQLIRMLTRGKSSRLSSQPLLDYFRPLEIWLEQQIRYEPVIGWNSNLEDVALYQYTSDGDTTIKGAFALIICTVFLPHFLYSWYTFQ